MSAIAIEKAYVHSVEFKTISREPEARDIDLATLRVRVDRSYRSGQNDDGSPRWNRDKDFWIDAEVWGSRSGALRNVVDKGASILMTGRYDVGTWEDNEGTSHTKVVFRASLVAILPWSIESVSFKSSGSRSDGHAEQLPPPDQFDDSDIPF